MPARASTVSRKIRRRSLKTYQNNVGLMKAGHAIGNGSHFKRRNGRDAGATSDYTLCSMKLARVLAPVLDFCYPARCAACNEACPTALLCDACEEAQTKAQEHPACDRCAKPLTEWLAPCPYCKGKGIRPFNRIAALGVYDDPLKAMIHRFKYEKHWGLGEALAERLLEQERVKDILSYAQVIVPVPLYRWREFKRGYNQSAVVANRLARGLEEGKFATVAKRIRATHTQTDLHSMEARVENVRGAFRLNRPAAISGKRVVVVDDVLTTGATLQAVGRVLNDAKPEALDAIVLAVADPRQRGFG